MTLGEKIYKLRTKRSMTQEQLAEKIGVSRQSVSKWETDSAIPDIEKLKLLAEIFEVSITELLGMECEEDTKRKDEKERIEHCQKEIKRWKRYAIVSIAICTLFRGRKDISEIKVCSGSGQRRNTNDRSC